MRRGGYQRLGDRSESRQVGKAASAAGSLVIVLSCEVPNCMVELEDVISVSKCILAWNPPLFSLAPQDLQCKPRLPDNIR